ncbi:hypothetical protein [Longibaculum muris]|uniref:hypothetical protein n=1 Tax=Longibaculum muris TaxID=1796628 RepID=UPI0022E810D6|nr:hypothetical protein [Longibaculum muris]
MKKFLITIIVLFTVFSNINYAFAFETKSIENAFIEVVFEDGSYIETIIEQNYLFTRASTTSGSKTSIFKDSEEKVLWTIKVSGSFSYNGSSATCTSSSISTTCPASNWKLSNKKSWKSGASAYASATAKQYTFLGICTNTVDRTLKLTCSSSGKLS